MKNRSLKIIYPVILCLLTYFTLSGCSTFKDMYSSIKFWDKGEKKYAVSQKEVSQFLEHVRPVRSNAYSHYLLATYYQERGKHKEALEEFRKVVRIDSECVIAYNGMGISYDNLGNYKKAVECYEKAILINPKLDYVYNNLGYSYVLQENFEKAIETFKKALTTSGSNKRIHNNLGFAYMMTEKYDLAMAEFELGGDKARALYNTGRAYYNKGMFSKAMDYYNQALAINPDLAVARKGLEASELLARFSRVKSQDSHDEKAATNEKVATNDSTSLAGHYHDAIHQMPVSETAVSRRIKEIDENQSSGLLKDARIEVSNGNGITNMAKKVGGFLKKRGFEVVRYTNANNFNYSSASIYYNKDYASVARRIAKAMPEIKNIKEMKELDRSNVKVKVLLGKNLIPYKNKYEGNKT
jgi:tetratricopeptide (TPR) repeat protein